MRRPALFALILMAAVVGGSVGLAPAVASADIRVTSDPADDADPAVAVDSGHLARIAWARLIGSHYQIMWGAFNSSGHCIVGPVQVTTSATSSRSPNIALDALDRSFIVWQEGAGTSAQTYFARIDADGTTGVAPLHLSIIPGYEWRPDIATTPEGVSHIIVQSTIISNWYTSYVRLSESGSVLCFNQPGDFNTFVWDKYPSIAIDPDGRPLMTWNDYNWTSQGLYAAEYQADPSCTRTQRTLIRNTSNISESAALAPRSGFWFILYERNSQICRWQAGGTDAVIDAGPARRPRTAGVEGQPIVAVWEDRSTSPYRVKSVRWDSLGVAVEESRLVSDGSGQATQPAIACNDQHTYAVAWRDDRHGDGEIYLDMRSTRGIAVEVRSITTDMALPQALVWRFEDGLAQDTLRTDADGQVRYLGLDPGEYTFAASFAGHQSRMVVGSVPEAGSATVTIRLATDTELFGSLADSYNGAPVAGARVVLHRNGGEVDTTVSGSDGGFLFNVTTAGDYHYVASKEGAPMPGAPAGILYAPAVSAVVAVAQGDKLKSLGTSLLDSRVVLMVHGWRASGDLWATSHFADTLRSRGWAVAHDIDLPGQIPLTQSYGWAGIEQQGRYLNAVMHQVNAQSFHIVAHSQGGLVSRFASEMLQREGRPRLGKLITLSTPHHGTPLAEDVVILANHLAGSLPSPYALPARFLIQSFLNEYPALRDLAPNSAFLRSLNQGDPSASDWSGWCVLDSPRPEQRLVPEVQYACLAADMPLGGLAYFLGGIALTGHGCVASDGIVPVASSHLHSSAGNVHNYLASSLGIIAHHKSADIPGIVQHPLTQTLVADWLADDPVAWPSPGPVAGGTDKAIGQWSRLGLTQILAANGATHEDSLLIDSCDTLQVSWTWFEGAVDLALVSPGGAVIDSAAAAADPAILYERDVSGRSGRFRIDQPAEGMWVMRTQGVAVTQEQLALVWADGESVLKLEVALTPDSPAIYADHTLAATLLDELQAPVSGATVTAEVTHPSQTSEVLALQDDGLAPDEYAGDGTYTGTIVVETAPGVTVVDVRAAGSSPREFARRRLTTIGIGPLTDIGILEPGLGVASGNRLAGSRIALRGSVRNYGTLAADVAVSVQLENTLTELYADTITLAVGEIAEVATSDLPLADGEYVYWLRVRPVGPVGEMDWQDNASRCVVMVNPPVTAVPGGNGDPGQPGGDDGGMPDLGGREAALLNVYPNPFNPAVTIECALAEPGEISLEIYDIRGRCVRRLRAGEMPRGAHRLQWDGLDAAGRSVSSGVYLLRLVAGKTVDRRKIMLLR